MRAVRGGQSALLIDKDADAIPDNQDNCPDAYNPDQIDSDNNWIGDACDTTYWQTLYQDCQIQLAACCNPTAISLSSLQANPSDKKIIFAGKQKQKLTTLASTSGGQKVSRKLIAQ